LTQREGRGIIMEDVRGGEVISEQGGRGGGGRQMDRRA